MWDLDFKILFQKAESQLEINNHDVEKHEHTRIDWFKKNISDQAASTNRYPNVKQYHKP